MLDGQAKILRVNLVEEEIGKSGENQKDQEYGGRKAPCEEK